MKAYSLTPVKDVVRYRLRRDERIVGWMREEATGNRFYSREGLWWSGRKIQWNQRDRCCGLRDVDDKWLHEGDVIQSVDGPWWSRKQSWLILCDEKEGWNAISVNGWRKVRTLGQNRLENVRWRWFGFGWLPSA